MLEGWPQFVHGRGLQLVANQIFQHSFERVCRVFLWRSRNKSEVLQTAVITGAGDVVGSLWHCLVDCAVGIHPANPSYLSVQYSTELAWTTVIFDLVYMLLRSPTPTTRLVFIKGWTAKRTAQQLRGRQKPSNERATGQQTRSLDQVNIQVVLLHSGCPPPHSQLKVLRTYLWFTTKPDPMWSVCY